MEAEALFLDPAEDKPIINVKIMNKSSAKTTTQIQLHRIANIFGYNSVFMDLDNELKGCATKIIQDNPDHIIEQTVKVSTFVEYEIDDEGNPVLDENGNKIKNEVLETEPKVVLMPTHIIKEIESKSGRKYTRRIIKDKFKDEHIELAVNSGMILQAEDGADLEDKVHRALHSVYDFSRGEELRGEIFDGSLYKHIQNRMRNKDLKNSVKGWLSNYYDRLMRRTKDIRIADHRKTEEKNKIFLEAQYLGEYLCGDLLKSNFQRLDENGNPTGPGELHYIFGEASLIMQAKEAIARDPSRGVGRLERVADILRTYYDIDVIYIDTALDEIKVSSYEVLYSGVDLIGVPALADDETRARMGPTIAQLEEIIDPKRIVCFLSQVPLDLSIKKQDGLHAELTEKIDGTTQRYSGRGLTPNKYLDEQGMIWSYPTLIQELGKNKSVFDYLFEQELMLEETIDSLMKTGNYKSSASIPLEHIEEKSEAIVKAKYSSVIDDPTIGSKVVSARRSFKMKYFLEALIAATDYKRLWETEMSRISRNRGILSY